ncbi:hypothetical protein M8J76_011120 [Diaphorina citri]|nr:hypothetical protein M8J76_011120 [Diaphorina citri]
MIYGTFPASYDVTLEQKRKQKLPAHNICIKHDNEETIQGGPSETTKTLRMTAASNREPLVTRKQKLKVKLIQEQSQWERELSDKLGQKEAQKQEGEEEIERLKCKLQDLQHQYAKQEEDVKRELIKKQEDLKRLNLLSASRARDLASLIQSRSAEYKKDATEANLKIVKMIHDKRNQKQTVMLWETRWLDQVLLPDNEEEKGREFRKQIEDFLVANGHLMDAKRKEQEEEQRRDEEYNRRKIEEYEKEKREEDTRREQERLLANQHSQAQLNYLNYKRKEREDCEKREKERELQLLMAEREKQIEEKEKSRREKEKNLEEIRQWLHMKQKYNEEKEQREKELAESMERENEKRNAAKLAQLNKAQELRKLNETHAQQVLIDQIEQQKRHCADRTRQKLAEIETWKQIRAEIKEEEEREKMRKTMEREKYLTSLRQQIEFKQHRNPC